MPREYISMRMDRELLARVDQRAPAGSRSQYVEQAVRAFLAHDEGCAVELAAVVRRLLLAEGVSERVRADAVAALARFEGRSRS